MFIALLAAAVWSFANVAHTCEPRHSILVLGNMAAALALTRLDGPLYAGLFPLAAFATKPSRWTGIGVSFCAILVLAVVVVSQIRLGRSWPVAGQDFRLRTLFQPQELSVVKRGLRCRGLC